MFGVICKDTFNRCMHYYGVTVCMCICPLLRFQFCAPGILLYPAMAARLIPNDMDEYIEGLLQYLSIELRPVVLGDIRQTKECHGIIDVRSLGSRSRSGDQEAHTPALLSRHSGRPCPPRQSLLRHHDGVYIQSMLHLAQSDEISEFFSVLGPALRSAALRSVLQGHNTVVLGVGCNHARHRSPAAAYLAAHWLRRLAARVDMNQTYMAKACQCTACVQGTKQAGFGSVFDHCKAAFFKNFCFKGRAEWQVAVSGIDNSGFSRDDAHPLHLGPPMLQDIVIEARLADKGASSEVRAGAPRATFEVPNPIRKGVDMPRSRSRSPVPRGGHTLPQPVLPTAPPASSSLTVQPQSL